MVDVRDSRQPPARVLARAYLEEVRSTVSLPRMVGGSVVLHDSASAPPIAEDDSDLRQQSPLVVDLHGVEERSAIGKFLALVAAIHLASSCSVEISHYWHASTGKMEAHRPIAGNWGHYDADLTEDALAFADRQLTTIDALLAPEKFSRVPNALRLYGEAMHTMNSDLALLGFVGALESLLAIATQELSFRLSLLLAKFLGDDREAQRAYFERAHALYATRSKIAHGDKIAEVEEAAAIQMTERWTPEGERLARLCLHRVLDRQLVELFNAKSRHKELLTDLLFLENLDHVLNKAR